NVDATLCYSGQLLIRISLFIKRGLQESRGFVVPEALSKCACCPVSGHFIMLNALCGGNKSRILHVRIALGPDHFLAFAEQSFHGLAGLALRLSAELAEDLFEPADLLFGLSQMSLKRALQ